MPHLNLSEKDRQEIIACIQEGRPIPTKYIPELIQSPNEVVLIWNGRTAEPFNTTCPFHTLEQVTALRPETNVSIDALSGDPRHSQKNHWTNKLFWGDNKLVLSSLINGPLREEIERQGGLQLIYIDPPFAMGSDFSCEISIGEDGRTPSTLRDIAYRDAWGKSIAPYLSMMYERLKLMHALLAENGSIYVHCAWKITHYLKLIMDDIWGADHFQREIIWRIGWVSGYKSATKNWIRNHDTILFYTKNEKKFTFNKAFIPYPSHYRRRGGSVPKGQGYPVEDTWNCSQIDPLDSIQIISFSSEKAGYPTQKNENLLHRIVTASSNEHDLVADFFCGSGTLPAVAEQLNRKWIACDLGRYAIHTTRKRLIQIQRDRKTENREYRPFELLTFGQYERGFRFGIPVTQFLRQQTESLDIRPPEYIQTVMDGYSGQRIDGYRLLQGKKGPRFIHIGPLYGPVTHQLIEEIFVECQACAISHVDVLGFEFTRNLPPDMIEAFHRRGVSMRLRIIPRDVLDPETVNRKQIRFCDMAYIHATPTVMNREIQITLDGFVTTYTEDRIPELERKLRKGRSRIIIETGQIIRLTKNEDGTLIRERLTKSWLDWVDDWSVDFDYEREKEYIRVYEDGEVREIWTGNYIFNNCWQSFRTRKNNVLERTTSPYRYALPGTYKLMIKVVDILGVDTSQMIEVTVY